jgi:transcription antitermination factor NusG
MTSWYAVYTLPGWEKKVAETLSKKQIENYCPQIRTNYDRKTKKVISAPLFPSYVFVKMDEQQATKIKKLRGVINLLYWLKDPVKIKDIEIEMVRRFLGEHTQVRLEKSAVSPGSIVKISTMPLFDKEENGVLLSCNTVKLLLPSIGYTIVTEVEEEVLNAKAIKELFEA